MSFLSLAQFSLQLCPGLNSARKFTKVANFHDDLVKTTKFTQSIGHFTVMDGSEGEGDLVLIQTFFALLWKLFLKNTS